MREFERVKLSNEGVIVTLYEESTTIIPKSSGMNNVNMRARKSRVRIESSLGYDRRAELLAYTNHLRHPTSQQDHTVANPMPKSKKRRLFGAWRKLRSSVGNLIGGKKRKWRYESIDPDEHNRKYRSRHHGRSKYTKMFKGVHRFLKRLPRSWACGCSKEP